MSEVNETASAAAETEQASNMSPSDFINRRLAQATTEAAEAPEVEEVEDQVEVQDSSEEQEQETAVSDEEAAEDEFTDEEGAEDDSGDKEHVLSQIELDDMTDEELRELSDKLGSRAVARFGELTAKRKSAEAELAKLKSEMGSQLQPEVKESDNPYRGIDSIESLQKTATEVEQVIEWAEELIFDSDGYSADDVVTEVEGNELTKSEVRKHLQNARKAQKKFIPAQLKSLQKRENAVAAKAQLMQQAEKELSWMQDENEVSEKYKLMLEDPRLQNLDRFDPEVAAQLPYLLAHAANSMYGRQPVAVKGKSKSTRLTPPSGTPGSARSDKKISKSIKNLQNAANTFKGSGKKDDFIRMRTLQLTQ